ERRPTPAADAARGRAALHPSSAFGTFSPRGGEKDSRRYALNRVPLAPRKRGEVAHRQLIRDQIVSVAEAIRL
ncbi:MAG: hypothetical protein ACXW3E_04710, partial [Thermoanaerobaculia bacterium]